MDETVEVEAEVVEDAESLEVTYTPATISANFDALEARVRSMVADYEGAVYDLADADAVRDAKRDRTFLNGIVKQIDERRKAVKREYTAPLAAFEDRCREISGIAKEASDGIKAQLDAAEEARRAARRESLRARYEEMADLLAPVVPYERIHDPRWELKSFGEKRAVAALEERVGGIARDWDTLKAQRDALGDAYGIAEREFFGTLDLGSALNAAREAAERDARIAEMKRAMEAPAPEPEPAGPEPEPAPPAPQPAPAAPPAPAPMAQDPAEERRPWVIVVNAATRADMVGIADILRMGGVQGQIMQGTVEEVYGRMTGYGR